MSLSDEYKKQIKEFILGESDVNPDTYLSSEDRVEALEYAKFICDREKLRMMSKLCRTQK